MGVLLGENLDLDREPDGLGERLLGGNHAVVCEQAGLPSLHRDQHIVGEFDLTSDFQATGSFSFGTGSLVAIEIIIPGGSSSPGNSNVTTIFEYDQFNEYFTGSGN